MLTTALTAILLTQRQASPETALAYTGMPRLETAGNIQIDWHTVVMTFDRETVKVESTTRFKDNSTGKTETKAKVMVPTWISGWADNWGANRSATWADKAINPTGVRDEMSFYAKPGINSMRTSFVQTTGSAPKPGELAPHNGRWTVYDVSFGQWSRQRTFKSTVVLPLQVLGLDGVERQVAYHFDKTNKPLSTMSIAFKYNSEQVFSVVDQGPKSWKWQVGANGAFAEKKNVTSTDEVVYFRWYRGGFKPIGTTGGN